MKPGMKPGGKRGALLAWGGSLLVHGLVLGGLVWWLDDRLKLDEPAARPVPMRLSMLTEPVAKPVEPPAEPVLEPVVEMPPLPEVMPEPPPEPEPTPVARPEPPVLPKPRPPEPKVKPKTKPPTKVAAVSPPLPAVTERTEEPAVTAAVPTEPVVAKVEPVSTPVLAAPVVVDADAEAAYKAHIRQKIDAHKHYPKLARRMGEEGRVVVEFSLDASGAVSSVRIKQSSGSARLDEAALQAVRDAAPFPPFPDGVGRKHWDFTLPLSFALDG